MRVSEMWKSSPILSKVGEKNGQCNTQREKKKLWGSLSNDIYWKEAKVEADNFTSSLHNQLLNSKGIPLLRYRTSFKGISSGRKDWIAIVSRKEDGGLAMDNC